MEGFKRLDLEVDSVADLRISVSDEASVKVEGIVSEQHAVRSVVGSGARSFSESRD